MCARSILLAAVMVVVAAGSAGAQSVFNLSLFGQRMESGDVRAVALGGPVQLVADSLGVSQFNPALIAYAKRVTFGANVYSSLDINKSAEGNDKEGSLRFSSLTFAFRGISRRLTLAVGYRARFDPSGGFSTTKVSAADEEYREVFERSGGLLSFPFSAAVDLGSRAKVGGFVSLETGRITNRWETSFTTLRNIDAFSDQERTMSGTGWGLGVEVSLAENLSLGATYEGEITYDTDIVETHTNASNDRTATEDGLLPERWTASLRWTISQRVTAYAGGAYSDMTKVRGMAFPVDRLHDETRVSLGFEVLRVMGSLPVRLSSSWEEFPYTLPDAAVVTRIAGTIGTGWNFRRGAGKLDVALQFVRTGSIGSNGLQNRSVRLYVGIGGAETWSHRRQRR